MMFVGIPVDTTLVGTMFWDMNDESKHGVYKEELWKDTVIHYTKFEVV